MIIKSGAPSNQEVMAGRACHRSFLGCCSVLTCLGLGKNDPVRPHQVFLRIANRNLSFDNCFQQQKCLTTGCHSPKKKVPQFRISPAAPEDWTSPLPATSYSVIDLLGPGNNATKCFFPSDDTDNSHIFAPLSTYSEEAENVLEAHL